MPRGGKRQGAGRKAGSATRKTREVADKAAQEGITPLEFMLNIMRGKPPEDADVTQKIAWEMQRFEAAKAAAPYIHPRLSSTEMKLDADVTNRGDFSELTADEWERRAQNVEAPAGSTEKPH